MSDVPTKGCSKCGEPKPLDGFYKHPDGRPRSQCKTCENGPRPRTRKPTTDEDRAFFRERERKVRRDPNKVPFCVMHDCRKSDKKRGLDNDLTLDFVTEALRSGCTYCGESTIRMTLDRRDNSIGHTQANVIAACIRCNYARGAMPFDAWMCLVSGMRSARERGLFGSWTGRARMLRG